MEQGKRAKWILDQTLLGEAHVTTLTRMLDNKTPIVFSIHNDSMTYTDDAGQKIPMTTAQLGSNATAIQEVLQQPRASKKLDIEQEATIYAAIRPQGYLRENQDFPLLSDQEKERVIKHSLITQEYSYLIMRTHKKHGNTTLGEALHNLFVALGSGTHRGGEADQRANEGIGAFSDYWNSYSKNEQSILYKKYPGLRKIITDLRPTVGNAEWCIGMIAEDIDRLLKDNPELYESYELLKEQTLRQLESSFAKSHYIVQENSWDKPGPIPPQTAVDEQLFRHAYTRRALKYTLEHQNTLSESFLRLLLSFDEAQRQPLLKFTNTYGNNALMQALSCHNITLVKTLICSIPRDLINSTNNNGDTALMLATMNKRAGADLSRMLLQAGANIDAANKFGQTAVTMAVRHSNMEALHVLIKHSLNPREAKRDALRYAIQNKVPMLDELLLEITTYPLDEQYGIFTNLLTEPTAGHQASTALMYAVMTERHDFIDELLTPLASLRSRATRAVLGLIKNNPLNAQNSVGDTALILAVRQNSLDSVKKLIAAGVDINVCNDAGETALSIACETNDTDISDVLVAHGGRARLQIPPIRQRYSPAHDHPRASSINARVTDSNLDTPLIRTARDGDLNGVKNLVAGGARLDDVNEQLKNALLVAIEKEHVDIALFLLENGADIRPLNATSPNVFSVLSSTCWSNKRFMDTILLAAVRLSLDDQKTLLNKLGCKSVLEYVLRQHPASLPAVLKELNTMADPETRLSILHARDSHGQTMLHVAIGEAIKRGDNTHLQQLLEMGCQINVCNTSGTPPLSYVIQYPLPIKLSVIRLLIQHGAKLTPRDTLGRNALDYTSECRADPKITSILLHEAVKLSPEEQAELLADFKPYTCVLTYAWIKHRNLYLDLLVNATEEQKTRVGEASNALANMCFDDKLAQLQEKIEELQGRWFTPIEALQTTTRLYDELKNASIEFLQDDKPLDDKKQTFKEKATHAIEQAEPILNRHRGFKPILDALKNLFYIRQLLKHHAETGEWTFFKSETDSAQKMRELKERIRDDDNTVENRPPPQ